MFFEVRAKCGHVGRNHYILKNFYIKAETAKMAAKLIRYAPRVKHDQKDAIIYVKEIDYEDYLVGICQNKIDEYFNIYNSSDQKRIELEDIVAEEKPEKKQTRSVGFKLRKQKIIEREARRMMLGVCYG